ncbi:hypothetical protein C8Q74DRAFT_1215218 [Fomes fomentarius]|nr:hypothetical protein C8Q74DRAFT_1215218 [Fomes fomentarius]
MPSCHLRPVEWMRTLRLTSARVRTGMMACPPALVLLAESGRRNVRCGAGTGTALGRAELSSLQVLTRQCRLATGETGDGGEYAAGASSRACAAAQRYDRAREGSVPRSPSLDSFLSPTPSKFSWWIVAPSKTVLSCLQLGPCEYSLPEGLALRAGMCLHVPLARAPCAVQHVSRHVPVLDGTTGLPLRDPRLPSLRSSKCPGSRSCQCAARTAIRAPPLPAALVWQVAWNPKLEALRASSDGGAAIASTTSWVSVRARRRPSLEEVRVTATLESRTQDPQGKLKKTLSVIRKSTKRIKTLALAESRKEEEMKKKHRRQEDEKKKPTPADPLSASVVPLGRRAPALCGRRRREDEKPLVDRRGGRSSTSDQGRPSQSPAQLAVAAHSVSNVDGPVGARVGRGRMSATVVSRPQETRSDGLGYLPMHTYYLSSGGASWARAVTKLFQSLRSIAAAPRSFCPWHTYKSPPYPTFPTGTHESHRRPRQVEDGSSTAPPPPPCDRPVVTQHTAYAGGTERKRQADPRRLGESSDVSSLARHPLGAWKEMWGHAAGRTRHRPQMIASELWSWGDPPVGSLIQVVALSGFPFPGREISEKSKQTGRRVQNLNELLDRAQGVRHSLLRSHVTQF